MNNLGSYFLIALGGASAIISIYQIFQGDDYFIPICSFIVGIGLIKTSLDKIKLQKEVGKD